MHRKCFILALVLSLFIMTATGWAQTAGRVSGTIVDQETGEPLMGANVLVVETSWGAATDENGEYMILNVPVGMYNLKVTYMGYGPVEIQQVKISIGLTTRLNFEMTSEAFATEGVTIIAERPLIEKTSTNASRVFTEDDFANLPLRGVNAVALLQPGTVLQDNNLYIRGGREDEVMTYIDGAAIRDVVTGDNRGTVIPEALEEMQVQAGGYTAQYGGANSAVIAMAIRSGSPDYKFSLRAETDNFAKSNEKFLGTYSYGYSDYTLTASGPIPGLGKKYRFFVAGENLFERDRYQRFWEPIDIVHGETLLDDGSAMNLVDTGLRGGQAGDSVSAIGWGGGVVPTGASYNRYTGNLVLTADLKNIKLRVSGIGSYRKFSSNLLPLMRMFNTNRFPVTENSDATITAKMTHVLSPKTFYEVSVSYYDARNKQYDPFMKEDYWSYRDSTANAAHGITFNNYYQDPRDYDIYGFPFDRDGDIQTNYLQWKRNYIGGKVDFTHQFKHHQLQFGGDVQYWTLKAFAGFTAEGPYQYLRTAPDVVTDPVKLEKYLKSLDNGTYGYDKLGNEGDEGLSEFDKARHPQIGALYLQDRYEWNDLVVNAGLRYDYYWMHQFEPKNYANPAVSVEDLEVDMDGWRWMNAFHAVSPRLGFGFPVTDNTKFHMQWGKFIQMPNLTNGYVSQSETMAHLTGGFFYPEPTAYSTRPERTTQYEVGFSQVLGNTAALEGTIFYKDVKDQLQAQRVFTNSDAEATVYDITTNGDFATTKGFELRFTLRRTSRVQGFVNYTLSMARGTGSYFNQASASLEQNTEQISIITPLYYNNTHRGNFSVDYRFGEGDGGKILERSGLNMMFNFSSGHPYTLSTGGLGQNDVSIGATLGDRDARFRYPLEPIGSSTTPWVFTMDARLDKTVNVGRFDLNFYVYSQNLLNAKNVINIFPRTGTDNDGFLNDESLSGSVISAQGGQGFEELYHAINDLNRQHYYLQDFNGSDIWGTPRQIRAGVLIEFK
ncbi:TonB-dependent receptor [candidate division KSB1 bacterium]|nr:TonB-dependent receptor [candidate division KSB1 bacterium]